MSITFADGTFTATEFVAFAPNITTVDLSTNSFSEYSGQHETGGYTVNNSNRGIELNGNTWQKTAFNYTFTDNTYLTFEFRSNALQGERHTIGFDTDNSLSTRDAKVFEIWGSETGKNGEDDRIPRIANYTGNGDWQTFTIKAGDYFNGDMQYLVFGNDDDIDDNANSQFRNIRVGELAPESTSLSYTGQSSITAKAGTFIRESVA
ncbi:hypothetical protein, partial [Agaribacter marinus]|uniref:hypothetical protein n=1 Tax=Agaribacter marinus TaxID=1431249 RepID=UPI0024E144E4